MNTRFDKIRIAKNPYVDFKIQTLCIELIGLYRPIQFSYFPHDTSFSFDFC